MVSSFSPLFSFESLLDFSLACPLESLSLDFRSLSTLLRFRSLERSLDFLLILSLDLARDDAENIKRINQIIELYF